MDKELAGLTKVQVADVFTILRALRSKGLTILGRARKHRISVKLFDLQRKTLSLSHFFADTLPIFKSFVLSFQVPSPKIHQIYDEMLKLYQAFLSRFVKPEHLEEASIKDLQFSKDELKGSSAVFTGRQALKGLSLQEVVAFKKLVKTAYITAGKYMQEKLPLNSQVLQSFGAIDPRAHGWEVSSKAMQGLLTLLPTVLPAEEDQTLF